MFYYGSIIKDGGYMMCEDASEYDENMAVAPAPAEVAQQEIAPHEGGDCFEHCFDKMSKLFDMMMNITSIQVPADNREAVVNYLTSTSDIAAKIAEKMRIAIVKQSSIRAYVSSSNFMYEPIHLNAGMIMKNKTKLMQQSSMSSISYEMITPAPFRCLNLPRLIDILKNDCPGLPNTPISIKDIQLAMWDTNENLQAFNSLAEIFSKFFDRETRYSVEMRENCNLTISQALERCHDYCCGKIGNGDSEHANIIKYISKVMKHVKMASYNLQCDIIDGADYVTDGYINKELRSIVTGIFNMFAVGMIYLIMVTYDNHTTRNARESQMYYIKDVTQLLLK